MRLIQETSVTMRRTRLIVAWLVVSVGWRHATSQAAYTVERLVTGLNQPIFAAQAPGDGSGLYVAERNDGSSQLGRIRRYDLATQTLTTFLDLSGSVASDGGVLAMAFRPDYATSGMFYVTSNDGGVNRLDEYQTIAGVPQFQRRLLQYNSLANVFHTINQPFFRPGGASTELYVTTGDGGTQADQGSFDPSLIESPNSIYGKVLRLDLSASFPTPASDATHAGIDVVALGLRNPYRASFDRVTGDFYLGDVGFNSVEEIDFIPASHFTSPSAPPLDFGWTSREGTIATVGGSAGGPGSPGDLQPVFDYAHSSSITLPHPSLLIGPSVTGGYLYRGPAPELQGRYFFADFVNGNVYSAAFDPDTNPASYNGNNFTDLVNHTTAFEALAGGGSNIQFVSSFAEDHAGNLYIIKFGNSFFPQLGQGQIFRISVPSAITAAVDRDSGAIVLTNNTGAPIALKALSMSSPFGGLDRASLTPITGHYDLAGDQSVDANDNWTVTSPLGSFTLLSESTSGTPGTIGIGQQVVLSPADGWIRSPSEDLTITLTRPDDSLINVAVAYVGNGSLPFARSDLDFDGELTPADWAVFVAGAGSNLASLSVAQAYGAGDLDGDRDNDYDDFQLFQADYVATHGLAALVQLEAGDVPEPAAGAAECWGGLACWRRKRKTGDREDVIRTLDN